MNLRPLGGMDRGMYLRDLEVVLSPVDPVPAPAERAVDGIESQARDGPIACDMVRAREALSTEDVAPHSPRHEAELFAVHVHVDVKRKEVQKVPIVELFSMLDERSTHDALSWKKSTTTLLIGLLLLLENMTFPTAMNWLLVRISYFQNPLAWRFMRFGAQSSALP